MTSINYEVTLLDKDGNMLAWDDKDTIEECKEFANDYVRRTNAAEAIVKIRKQTLIDYEDHFSIKYDIVEEYNV